MAVLGGLVTKGDEITSCGVKAFLALLDEIPSSENESFWQHISALRSVFIVGGRKKRKWK